MTVSLVVFLVITVLIFGMTWLDLWRVPRVALFASGVWLFLFVIIWLEHNGSGSFRGTLNLVSTAYFLIFVVSAGRPRNMFNPAKTRGLTGPALDKADYRGFLGIAAWFILMLIAVYGAHLAGLSIYK